MYDFNVFFKENFLLKKHMINIFFFSILLRDNRLADLRATEESATNISPSCSRPFRDSFETLVYLDRVSSSRDSVSPLNVPLIVVSHAR